MKHLPILFLPALIFFVSCNNNKEEATVEKNNAATQKYLKQLASVLAVNRDSVGLRFNYINALDSTGDYKTAIAQMDSLISKDKGNYGLWFKMGQLYEHSQDTVQSLTAYTNAYQIYKSPEVILALANLYAETKNTKALELCKQVAGLKLGREYDSYGNFFSGVYYARTGNRPLAISFFNKSIADNYTLMDAYMEKGFAFYDDKKLNKAIVVFGEAVTVNNTYADAYYWQGKCYEAMNNKQQAIDKYKQAYGLDKNMVEAKAAFEKLQ